MNKFLERFNLIGVVALAGLCVMQWKVNRDVNTEVIRLQKAQLEQGAKIKDQEKTIVGQASDLETFRAQLVTAMDEKKSLGGKSVEMERANRQLEAETGQLKSSLTNWVAAVKARDEQLQETTTQLKTAVASRDEAIDKYNDLAKKHNQLVADFNRAATNMAAAKN
jgi:chromosome segregation ATPase